MKTKILFCLLFVVALSGCVYPKDTLNQAQISERFSVSPSTSNIKVVYNGENFDYAISTIVDERMFAVWKDVQNQEVISLVRELDDEGNFHSYLEIENAYYPMIYFLPYAFIVSAEDAYFTIDALTSETMTITLHTPEGEFPRNFVRLKLAPNT